MNGFNEHRGLIQLLAMVVTIFIAFILIAYKIDTGIACVFVIMSGFFCYLIHYKNANGFSSLKEAFDDRRNAYLEKVRTERKVQLLAVVCILITCFMVTQWWSTPRRLRLKIYESVGNISSLCDFYDEAYNKGYRKLAVETAEVLSKFASEESRVFLGEKLVLAVDEQTVHELISSLNRNDVNAFEFIINAYRFKRDDDALIELFRVFKSNSAEIASSNLHMCIDALADINVGRADNFLDEKILSDKELSKVIVAAYEKSNNNSIEDKIKRYEQRITDYNKLLDNDIKILEAYGEFAKYNGLVGDALINIGVTCLDKEQERDDTSLVQMIKRQTSKPIKPRVKNFYWRLDQLIEKLAKEEQLKKARQEIVARYEEPIKQLKDKLDPKNIDKRREELIFSIHAIKEALDNQNLQMYRIENLGLDATIKGNISMTNKYIKDWYELEDLNRGYPKVRSELQELEANRKEKLDKYDVKLKDIKQEKKEIVSLIKFANEGFEEKTKEEWIEILDKKGYVSKIKEDWQESLNGVYLGMSFADALRVAGNPKEINDFGAYYKGWSFRCDNGLVSELTLGEGGEIKHKEYGLKFEKCGLMQISDLDKLVKQGLAANYYSPGRHIYNYVKLNTGEVFSVSAGHVSLRSKLPVGARFDDRTF